MLDLDRCNLHYLGTDHYKSDGGRGGGFSACTIVFFRPLLVQEFFLQVKPSARIFFFRQILLCLSFTNQKELFYKRIVVLCWF